MKFVFQDLGPKKISKTVEVVLSPIQSFYDMGFDHQVDFIIREASVHFPGDEKRIEAVAIDGLPELMAHNYVIVWKGSWQKGRVSVLP